MAIYTQERRGGVPYMWELSASNSATFRAGEEEALATNPIVGLQKVLDIPDEQPEHTPETEAEGLQNSQESMQQLLSGLDDPESVRLSEDPDTLNIPEHRSPLVAATDARRLAKKAGVTLKIPDDGIEEDVLESLITYKKDEDNRRDYMARAPSNASAFWAGLGGGFWGSLKDPVNIASGFIPFVGPAKYTAMLGRAGGKMARAGVRGRVGATEGLLGAAVVEPLVLYGVHANQADYTAVDSLLNLAFGTFMGGGLHVGAGAIKDAVSRGIPPSRARPNVRGALDDVVERLGPDIRRAEAAKAINHALTGVNTNAGNYAAHIRARIYDSPIGPTRPASGVKFYRGTTGGSERIDEPFSEAKGLTFVSRKKESAQNYGDNIEEIIADPAAKILDDKSPEFWRLVGRRRPPNGFIGSARGGVIEVVNDAVRKAKAAGYDAVSFSSDADIGTIILNESAFTRNAQDTNLAATARPQYADLATAARATDSTFSSGVQGPWRPEYESLTPNAQNNLDYKRYVQEHTREDMDVYGPENARLMNPEASRIADEHAAEPDIDDALADLTEEALEDMEAKIRAYGVEDELEKVAAEMAEADRVAADQGKIFRAAALCPSGRA